MKKIGLLAVLLVVAVGGYYGWSQRDHSHAYGHHDHHTDDAMNKYAALGGDFTLTGLNGPVSLSDYQGKAVVLYFGFTRCPDFCPYSMRVVADAFDALGEQQSEVQGLLVTIDPNNDSPEVLQQYLAAFHNNLTGLRGEPDQIKAVAKQYAAHVQMIDGNHQHHDHGGQHLAHSSNFYIIDKDQQLVDVMPFETTPEELKARLASLL